MYPKKNTHEGKFVVFEGIAKSGKSSRAKILAEKLQNRGCDVLLTKEPTDSLAEGRRVIKVCKSEKDIKDPKALERDFHIACVKHIKNEIVPALKRGTIVIADRSFFSALAYGFALRVDKKFLYDLSQDILIPDIMFFMHTTPSLVCKRLSEQKRHRCLFEKEKYLRAIFGAYQSIIRDFLSKTHIRILMGDLHEEYMLSKQMDKYVNLVAKN